MAKIIDILFPIAPLPKDKKERNAVIDGYEKSIETSINGNVKLLLIVLVFLFIGTLSVSNSYSVFSIASLTCILLPTLLYFISLILLICYKLKRKVQSVHAKHIITVLCSFVFSISFIDFLLGFINSDYWNDNKNTELNLETYLYIFGISIIFYYIGYWYLLRTFNKRIRKVQKGSKTIGAGALGGIVAYLIVKGLAYSIIISIFLPCILIIVAISAGALVDYRQYDNIQRAKKGMTFK